MISITLGSTTLALVTSGVGLLRLGWFLARFGARLSTARCRSGGFLISGPRRGPGSARDISRSRGWPGVRGRPLGPAGDTWGGRLSGVVLLGKVES